MAIKLVLALTAAFAIGAAHSYSVAVHRNHRSLRHHQHEHGFEQPLNLNVHNASGPITETKQGCGSAVATTLDDMHNLQARCPKSCPLWVDDSTSAKACDFACVSNSIQSCKDKNPLTPIADPETGVCRRCEVTGCAHCHPSGEERCDECMEGFTLKSNGYCGYTWGYFIGYCTIILLLIVVAFFVVIVVGWIVDLAFRETVNQEGLNHALELRSRAKIHMPKVKLLLHESDVKSRGSTSRSTNGTEEYEVVNGGTYFLEGKDGQPSTASETVAEKGDIVMGRIQDGWFRRHSSRKLWPLMTNLCREDVAGPAVTLLFNFQAAIIVWAFVIVVTWRLVVAYTGEELMTLGKEAVQTDRQTCIMVEYGYHTQKRLMYVKVGFLLFAYLFSFVGALLFGIRQWRIYTSDTGHTHRDFCAVFTGLPAIPGDVKVEHELKEQIEAATGKTVIGVSVGWEVPDKYDDFESAMGFQISELENPGSVAQMTPKEMRANSSRTTTEEPTPRTNTEEPTQSDTPKEEGEPNANASSALEKVQYASKKAHSMAMYVEGLFLHPVTQALVTRGRQKKKLKPKEENAEEKEKSFLGRHEVSGATNLASSVVCLDPELLKVAIQDLHTATTAFVVFESEFGRDEAVEKIKEDGMEFRFSKKKGEEETCLLRAEVPDYEPQSVLWQNLSSDHSWVSTLKKVAWMFGVVVMTCIFLAIFEYGYAIVQINNVRSSGEEGITLSFIMFTVLVASMMACLCAISATVAEMARFERVGQRETCFVLLYTFSVILQVSLDAVIAYAVGKNLMEANGVRTHDGTLLSDLRSDTHFTEIFESYAMQKHIGVTILSFGFPCAFLVPFLIEPIVSIFLPYKIMSLLVGSHPELKGNSAEGYMEAVPMDLGRYGDCMINVIIASMILWFPSGFNMTMFTFLFCSHCYIYLYDHYRMLRSVASVYIATYSVDFWAQWIFSVPCAIIMSALTFKLNCEPWLPEFLPGMGIGFPGFDNKPWGTHCDEGRNVWIKVGITFFGHIAVHTFLLVFVVPLFGVEDPTEKDHVYKDTAERIPCSWFSGNLIHCLRSKYIYAHDPPQDMCVSGKEHVMRSHPKIGACFKGEMVESEDYSGKFFRDIGHSFGKSLSMKGKEEPQSEGQEITK